MRFLFDGYQVCFVVAFVAALIVVVVVGGGGLAAAKCWFYGNDSRQRANLGSLKMQLFSASIKGALYTTQHA